MGQVSSPQTPPALILTSVDRLVASNADGGIGPGVSHIILLGQNAGRNDAASDVIGLGENSLGGAGPGLSSTALNGSIAIGSGALANIEGPGTGATATAAIIAIGRNAEGAVHFANSNVVVGDNALASNLADTTTPTERNVVLGANAARDVNTAGIAVQVQRDVIIGYNAGRPAGGVTNRGIFQSVVIGDSALPDFVSPATNGVGGCVIIGQAACTGLDTSGNPSLEAVIIGHAAGTNLASPLCVAIGSSAAILGANLTGQIAIGAGASSNSVSATVLGTSAAIGASADGSIAIGSGAIIPVNSANSVSIGQGAAPLNGARNILLGAFVGNAEPAANADRFIVETAVVGVRRGVLYGNMANGNLIVGLSTPGVDRDLPGTNLLKLLNGTATGNPVGGGMHYVTAGELAWRSSTGADYFTQTMSRGVFTFATLPAAALAAGQRAYVSNALAPAFGAAVAGGGAVFTPVFYNGAAWIVG